MLSAAESRVVDAIEEKGVVALLADLVRTPSVNPPGDEEAVAVLIARWLERA